MPTKLKALIGLTGVSILLHFLSLNLLSVLIVVGLLVGVLRGSETARTLMVAFAWLGVALSGAGIVLTLGSVSDTAPTVSALLGGFLTAFFATYVLFQNGFFIWCLGQPDVQEWMFFRSLRGDPAVTEGLV